MQIFDALKKDHINVKRLLSELVALNENDEKARSSIINEIRDELIPHARAEESVLYNSLRAMDAAKELALHGFKEHMEAEMLLRTLQLKDFVDADWKETARKLKEAIEHHIQEEEERMFNVAQQMFTSEEAEMMGEAFEELKPKIKEGGMVRSTIDMIANLMPPRFAASLKTFHLNP